MTLDSTTLTWLVIIGLAIVLIFVFRRRQPPERPQPPSFDHEAIIEQSRQVAEEVARESAERAGQAAVSAYQQQQQDLKEAEAVKRREASARAKETRKKRIESLQEWRPPFVQFVRRIAEPFFITYSVDQAQLDEWAEERADTYIARKPYVLEIVQWIHADAQRAADELSSRQTKSTREIAREKARATSRKLTRNSDCPYCGCVLQAGTEHLDHIWPVNRGGPSEAWNMVFACVPCNRAKRDLTVDEFMNSDYAVRKGLDPSEVKSRLESMGKDPVFTLRG